ncbi:MAG: TonB-dependent receptor [Gemmatimonadetes bacterium]|nr:TonB-dependent receptor [Gemmatimonadota bacterium]
MTAGRAALCLVALAAAPAVVGAQATVAVSGRIVAGGEPLPGAQVRVAGHPAVRSDAGGRFRLPAIRPGTRTVEVRALGHAPLQREVTLSRDIDLGELALVPLAVEVGDLVVTGTLAEVRLEDSPVKVEVVSRTALERNLTTNLMESIRSLPGLREQVDCGVCYTNSISINGMEGPYTAVLYDGVPVLGALSSVYALNSLNPALIEQVEIVRGPASTLYGSEAMGGVVNVITRDPRSAPAWSVTANGSSHGESTLDGMIRPALGGGRLLAAVSATHHRRFIDGNDDSFSDRPLVTRYTGFAKWSDASASRRRLDVQARYWHEDRFGGVRGWTTADRGSDRVYGESILTRRWEALAGWRPLIGGQPLRIDAALSGHDQASWYGTQAFHATQHTAFAQVAWAPAAGTGWLRPLLGATLRRQRYDDDTPATPQADDRLVPGLFAEAEAAVTERWTVLAGMRVDRHAAHGVIPSPRVAIRWEATDRTTVRLNLATGFRVVNLFTEDHAALTGSRQVVIEEALRPERSVTATAAVRAVIGVGTLPVTVDADAYLTRFGNRIIPDYDADPDLVRYRNLRGHSITRGVSLAASAAPATAPIAFRVAASWQRVSRTDLGVTTPVPFAPTFKGDFTFSWTTPGRVTVDWTGSVTGPMALPRLEGHAASSPWFTEQHLQASRALLENTFLTVGVKNLLDTRQRDPIVAPDEPFGPAFDTNRVWGPVQGRRVFVAVQWNGDP